MGQNGTSLFCGEFVELTQLVIDNEADENDIAKFWEYVNSCKDCAEYYDMEKATREFIRSNTPKTSVPPSLADEIRNKIWQFA